MIKFVSLAFLTFVVVPAASLAQDKIVTTIDHQAGGRTEVTTDRLGTRAERDGGNNGSHDRGGRDAATHRDVVRENTQSGDKVSKPERR